MEVQRSEMDNGGEQGRLSWVVEVKDLVDSQFVKSIICRVELAP